MDLKNFVTGLTIADKIYLYNTLYKDLACEGIDGDTELAHVNVQEMSVLRAMGGSGTINPNTNLLQFGGGGSPPPPPPATQTVTQQATIPDELKPFITDILEKSKAIQERREEEGYVPFQGPRLADFTEEQQTAFEGIEGLQGAGQPFFDRSTALTEASAQAPTAQSVSDFSNPFIQNVIDIQKREAQRLGDVERQQIGAQAVQAGGFGGSRHAILEAEQSRNLQQQLGDIQSRGSAAAFEDAQARLQQQRERERQAGAQFAGLGSQVPGQRLREITGLEAVGAQKQSLGQAGIDIAAQEFEIGRSFPERTLQDYQSIVRGYAQPIPASTLQRASSQQPAPSFLSQAAGLGAAGIGAFKAFGGNAQGGLVGLAEGGLPAGGTALESSTEAISTRAQNDPLTQVERPPLSQGQQFVRGQENQEAATVEDQLQQIQGLALGATNAIAQGQQKLATMNTAPGMGAQPANFGGNVGSFGFKKGGLLGLKHLANGGTVRLAAGGTPGGSSDGTQKDIISRLSMDELLKASSNPNFSIKMVTDELMKRKDDRTDRSMSERRLKSRAERDSFPAISEEEVSNTLLTESYTPEQSILKQLESTVKPEDTQSFAQRQLKDKQPPAQSELTGKEITGPEAFKLRSENKSESPLQKHIRETGGKLPNILPSDASPIRQDVTSALKTAGETVTKPFVDMYDRSSGPFGQLTSEKDLREARMAAGKAMDESQNQYVFGTTKGREDAQAKINPLLQKVREEEEKRMIEKSKDRRPSATVSLPNSMQNRLQSTDEEITNTNIIGLDESTGREDDKSISEIVEQGTIQDVSMDMGTGDRDSDPIAMGDTARLEAISLGVDTTKPVAKEFTNVISMVDPFAKKEELMAKMEDMTKKERKDLMDLREGLDKDKYLELMNLGFSILAQPGGQTFLQAIGKGAVDSKLVSNLSKLNDKQRSLMMKASSLDRRDLKEELNFTDKQIDNYYKNKSLDLKEMEIEGLIANTKDANKLKGLKFKLDQFNKERTYLLNRDKHDLAKQKISKGDDLSLEDIKDLVETGAYDRQGLETLRNSGSISNKASSAIGSYLDGTASRNAKTRVALRENLKKRKIQE